MLGAVVWATVQDIEVPWSMFGYYTALLATMALCFLGIGMLISAVARTTDIAQGAAFMVWLVLLLFLDLILLGVMIQGKISPELAVSLALINPLQVFPYRGSRPVRPAVDRPRPFRLRHPRSVRGDGLQGVCPGLSGVHRLGLCDSRLPNLPPWRFALGMTISAFLQKAGTP